MDNKYCEFLKSNFPNFPNPDLKEIEQIYIKICENNILTDFFVEKLRELDKEISIEFINRYKKTLNKLLIYIGVNDEDIINFSFRSSVEYILKSLCSFNEFSSEEKINKLSFRSISELLKKEENYLYTDMKVDSSNLLSLYGKFSNEVHGKVDIKINELEYMNLILGTNHVDYSKIYNNICNIVDTYEKIFIRALNISLSNIDASIIFKLSNIVSNKRIKKIFIDEVYSKK
nr:MAG TPA: hypothetical protein [Caudoviricetes sp.]